MTDRRTDGRSEREKERERVPIFQEYAFERSSQNAIAGWNKDMASGILTKFLTVDPLWVT